MSARPTNGDALSTGLRAASATECPSDRVVSTAPVLDGLGTEAGAETPEESVFASSASILRLENGPNFVVTPFIEALCERGLRYLRSGIPVHLSGPAGVGKTTIALHLASMLNRPVVVLHGDAEHKRSDLVGSVGGYQRSEVIDNFIHSVMKSEESVRRVWVADRLTTACQNGYTLVYDEFTRSRPETNNVLLGILGESVLDLPEAGSGGRYLRVHPDFAAIFTSNPAEYTGTHSCQDALLDRMVTLNLSGFDPETEAAVVAARSGVGLDDARIVVRLARTLARGHKLHHRSTLRGTLIVAKALAQSGTRPLATNPIFRDACLDAFGSHSNGRTSGAALRQRILQCLARIAPKEIVARRGRSLLAHGSGR